jgi:UDP-glucose 4-epimerase
MVAEPFRTLRVWDLPPEAMQLLRYGRAIDNRRYKRAGFQYSYTTAGTVEAFAQGLRLAGTVGDKHPSYRYEREVEDFFRHSPAVVRPD